MDSRLRIVVTGLIAQHPLLGGITWHYLQYVLGLKLLGHDVFYLEDSGEWPYKLDGGDWAPSDSRPNVEYLADVMAEFSLSDRWAYKCGPDHRWYGISDGRRRTVLRSADLLINVSGSVWRPWEYDEVERRAYIDTDPVFTQVNLARGDAELGAKVSAHDVHFSFGERLERVPETPFRWYPTRQPIVLSEWAPAAERRDVFTTVMNWTSYVPSTYEGETYGLKDVEFARFVTLPRRVTPSLEVALPLLEHPEWQVTESTRGNETPGSEENATVHDFLSSAGWHVVDSTSSCAGFRQYRDYISSSKAEWTVAKNAYVRAQAGWFSERSACYLASGRPVVTQDTGLTGILPGGEGLVFFTTLDEAVAGVESVESEYSRHAGAARDLAAEYFRAETVLDRLIDDATRTA